MAGTIVLAATSHLSAQGIAFNAVGRNSAKSDPNWNGGDYYGRRRKGNEQYAFDLAEQFGVERYL